MPQWFANKPGITMLVIAAVGWYLAARAAAEALSAGKNSAGRSAIGYWMPTFLVVVAAIALDKADIAISVIFGASVAALTLVLGVVTISTSDTRCTSPRRMWGFVLPAALICLMIGFSGAVTPFDAGVLLLEGLALLALWNDGEQKVEANLLTPRNWVMLIAAMIAAMVAAFAGLRGVYDISAMQGIRDGLVTQALVGPLLVLPMIGTATAAANQGRYDQAISSAVGYALLNLCLLLPVAALMWYARSNLPTMLAAIHGPTTAPATMPSDELAAALQYPLGIWRVDTVLLAVLGLLLLPVALGRWTLGKAEGIAMLFGYVVYIVLSMFITR